MNFLIPILSSVMLNYIGRYEWYISLLNWLASQLLELVTMCVAGVLTCILAGFYLLLILIGGGIIISVIMLPLFLSHYFGSGYFNLLFILSIPLGLLMWSLLLDLLDR